MTGWPTPPPIPNGPPASGSPITPIQSRAAAVDRASAAAGQPYELLGFISINGQGASVQEVDFPVRFIELPNISHGWSLEAGEQLAPGNWPSVDLGAARWKYESHPMNINYYAGAFLAVSVCGTDAQKLVVHYRIVGRTVGVFGTSADQSADGTV